METAIKIYGIPESRAMRCLWMARELGVPHENVPVHFNETRESPELMAVNPNARVPALDDRGLHLCESMAINLYLAKRYGAGRDIMPGNVEDEARIIQWSFWVITEIERPLVAIMRHALGRSVLDEVTLAQHATMLRRPLSVLQAHLAGRRWLVTESFTAADLNVASVLSCSRGARFDLSPWVDVAAWLDRCLARPAFGR